MKFMNMVDVLYKELCPLKALKIVEFIGQLDSFGSIFICFWELEELHKCVKLSKPSSGKSMEKAKLHLDLGNKIYKEKRYSEAMVCYNECVKYAPTPPKTHPADSGEASINIKESSGDTNKNYNYLANAYANRSAVFVVIKEYNYAIFDIERALRLDISEGLRKSLTERRRKCIIMRPHTELFPSYSPNQRRPPMLNFRNIKVPAYSDALGFAYTPEKGRHVVATRDIHVGEIIAVEESYCTRGISDKMIKHCSFCLTLCRAPVPCPDCIKVSFCSDQCKRRGLKEHKKECYILQMIEVLNLSGNSQAVLAVKILIRATFASLKGRLTLLEREEIDGYRDELCFNEENMYISGDYRTVHHLATLRRKKKRGTLLFASGLTAFVLVKVLHHSQAFYVDKSGCPYEPSTEDLLTTGSLLLHHMCVYPTPFSLQATEKCDFETLQYVAAEGVFPALSLLRHSCNAPTLHYNIRKSKVVKAFLPIREGQEVMLSIGERYHTTSLVNRQVILQNLGLQCSCEACEGDWPQETNEEILRIYKCITCGNPVTVEETTTCNICKVCYDGKGVEKTKKSLIRKWGAMVSKVLNSEFMFFEVESDVLSGLNVSSCDLHQVCEFASLINQHIQPPHNLFTKVLDLLRFLSYIGDANSSYDIPIDI